MPSGRARAGDLPPLTYLTTDSVVDGIGLSQVFRYVERLAESGIEVTLHSFEKAAPPTERATRLGDAGVDWHPHRFRPGAAAGAARVAQGAALVARAELIHARCDMAAASAVLARRPAWVWDIRSFWREQRVEMGLLQTGSPYDRVMHSIERASARRCTAIVTLSQSAAEVLGRRFGEAVAAKSNVITTCVDLDFFPCSSFPPASKVRFLLAGTLNLLYDVPCMLRLVELTQARRPTDITVLKPAPSPWDELFHGVGLTPQSAEASEMPARVAEHHVGFSVLRADIGVSIRAVTPTKIGEFLAAGRPVVVNGGWATSTSCWASSTAGWSWVTAPTPGSKRRLTPSSAWWTTPGRRPAAGRWPRSTSTWTGASSS